MSPSAKNHAALDYRRRPDSGAARVMYLGAIDTPYRDRNGRDRLGRSAGWYTDQGAMRRDTLWLWRRGAGSIFTAAQPLRPGVFAEKLAAWEELAAKDPDAYPSWAEPRLNRLLIGRRGNDLVDADVERYGAMFIDLDPVREKGAPAMPEQIEEARRVSLDIRDFLQELGAPDPIVARSGNGYHLLYRCDLPADEIGADVMRLALRTLARRFGTAEVSIDESVSSPGQKIRLHGLPNKKRDAAGQLIAELDTGVDEMPDEFELLPATMIETLGRESLPDELRNRPIREALKAASKRQGPRPNYRPVSQELLDWRLDIALAALRRAGYALRERRDGSHEIEACPFLAGTIHPSGPWKTRIALDPTKPGPVVTCVAESCQPALSAHVAQGGSGYTLLRRLLLPFFSACEAAQPATRKHPTPVSPD